MKKLLIALACAVMTLASTAAMAAPDPENTWDIDLKDGRVVIELRPDLSPQHVARLKELTRQGFYDGADIPSRHPRLHGANWRPAGQRHGRQREEHPG